MIEREGDVCGVETGISQKDGRLDAFGSRRCDDGALHCVSGIY